MPLIAGILSTSAGRRQQAHLARLGVRLQMIERHLADAAGRLVDGAQERQVVARVEQQPQVGEESRFSLRSKKARPLDDLERHALLDEGRFQAARQGVDAQEDGEVAVVRACPPRPPRGCAGRCPPPRPGRSRTVSTVDRLPGGVVGDQRLRLALLVVGDQARRRRAGSTWCCGSSRQRDDAGVGEVALEVEDVADVGAAQFVDRLIGSPTTHRFGNRPTARGRWRTGPGWCPGTRRSARSGSGRPARPAAPGRSSAPGRASSSRSSKSSALASRSCFS